MKSHLQRMVRRAWLSYKDKCAKKREKVIMNMKRRGTEFDNKATFNLKVPPTKNN